MLVVTILHFVGPTLSHSTWTLERLLPRWLSEPAEVPSLLLSSQAEVPSLLQHRPVPQSGFKFTSNSVFFFFFFYLKDTNLVLGRALPLP